MSKNKKKTKVVVNRAFLNNLADIIYNPKTKAFLRLCDQERLSSDQEARFARTGQGTPS